MPATVPPVTTAPPPARLVRGVNPVMRALLRAPDPLHRLVSDALLLLCFRGRRTGRRYEIPVGYHDLEGRPTVFTGSAWKENLRDLPPVAVVLRGHVRHGTAELVDDPGVVAVAYEHVLDQIGLRNARRLGLRADPLRQPTREDLRRAAAGRALIRLHLGGGPADPAGTAAPTPPGT